MKRGTCIAALALLASLPFAAGCLSHDAPHTGAAGVARPQVPSGARLTVRLTSSISSEYAKAGDPWAGVVMTPVAGPGGEAIPAGAEVRGTITGAVEARPGSKAMLDLAIAEIAIDGKPVTLHAATEPVVSGSPHARHLGAIASGIAEGALNATAKEGQEPGHDLTGVVGYQIILKEGTVIDFVVTDEVAMR
ncbi:MAG TPA: hypothetical protein VJY35_06780 [Candidatus Eisenbacteria bacterium]|nr:hypothetical protein [Candidatus Eisenbacteria bacterium]